MTAWESSSDFPCTITINASRIYRRHIHTLGEILIATQFCVTKGQLEDFLFHTLCCSAPEAAIQPSLPRMGKAFSCVVLDWRDSYAVTSVYHQDKDQGS